MPYLRETSGYYAEASPRGVRITAKEKNVTRKIRVVCLDTWRELQTYSDASFNGACCLELGIGTFTRRKPNPFRMG
jgi:hypothetical protein